MDERIRTLVVGLVIVGFGVAAAGCTGAVDSGTPAGVPTAAPSAAPTAVPIPKADPTPTFAGQVIDIAAKDQVFSLTEMQVAAGSAFEIRFENQDEYSHSIYITEGVRPPYLTFNEALNGPSLFKGEYIRGPATISYRVDALVPGTYQFFCPPHLPMIGTVEVR